MSLYSVKRFVCFINGRTWHQYHKIVVIGIRVVRMTTTIEWTTFGWSMMAMSNDVALVTQWRMSTILLMTITKKSDHYRSVVDW